MKTAQIALSLLSVALLAACSSTQIAQQDTLEQRLKAKYAVADVNSQEPAPPAEGPQDVPAMHPDGVDHNPTIVPSPLLRYWASSRTP